MASQTFRVTTYEIGAGDFSGTSLDLTLNNALQVNYFVLVNGAGASPSPTPADTGVRVTQDPHGTGDLATSSGASVIRLERSGSTEDWVGTITVVECLAGTCTAGFQLLDVLEVSLSAMTDTEIQTFSATLSTPWTRKDRVMVLGGMRAGGLTTAATALTSWPTLGVGAYHQGADTVALVRSADATADAEAATATVYVLEWGSEWQVEQITTGAAGRDTSLDDTSAWTPIPLDTDITAARAWVHFSATGLDSAPGHGWLGTCVAPGDGVTDPSGQLSTVSMGRVSNYAAITYAYILSHPSLAVEWESYISESGASSTMTTSAPALAETRGTTGAGLAYTEGARWGEAQELHRYYADAGHGNACPGVRHTADTTLTASRPASTTTWDGWLQSVDLGSVLTGSTLTSTDDSQDHYAGLIIPDERAEIWEAESSCSQAGPEPGLAVAQQDTGMVLRTSGSMGADQALSVRTLRGGFPGSDGATFTWKNVGDSQDRGWDVPNVLTAWTAIEWTDASGDLKYTRHPHAVTLADGTVLVAYEVNDQGEVNPYQILVRAMDPETGEWGSPVTVWEQSSAPGVHAYPALMVLPSGRVQLYHYVVDSLADETQIRAWYSDDDGTTWGLAQDYCLSTVIPTASSGATEYELGRIRAAYSSGQVLLVCHLVSRDTSRDYLDTIRQYASSDLGITFVEIDEWSGDIGGGYPDLVVAGGRLVMVYVSPLGLDACARLVGSAYTALSDVTEDTVHGVVAWGAVSGSTPGAYLTDGGIAACVDEQGTAYVYGRAVASNQEGLVLRSSDYGETWESVGSSSSPGGTSTWVNLADSSTYPEDFACTASRGRVVMPHNWAANPGNEGVSLGCAYLGGFSSVTMPGFERFPTEVSRVGWVRTWLPYDLPQDVGWTATGSAATEQLANGRLALTTSGTSRAYYLALTSTIDEPLIFRFALECKTGGNLAGSDVSIYIRHDDSTEGYQAEIRFTPTGYRVWDATLGTAVGADQAISGPVDIVVAVGQGKVATWYRARSLAADREWTVGPSGALGDSGGSAWGNLVEWGHRASTSSTTRWWEVHAVSDQYSGEGLHEGQDNPDGLFGRPYSYQGSTLPSGTKLLAVDGATIRADEWAITTHYRYGVERIWDQQPRRPYRSTNTSEQSIAIRLSEYGDTSLGSDLIGIALYGTNVPQFALYGYDDDTSSWVSLGTAKGYQGLEGLAYTRQGSSVRPSRSTASSSELFLEYHELAGGYFWFDSDDSRTIATSTEGKWTDGTTRTPTLALEDVDGTESTSGTDGRIVPRSWAVLVHLNGATYSAYKLVIPASGATVPEPPQGYYEIGALVIGPVVLFSEDYSWGRAVETQAGVELTEARDRTVTSLVVAPARRTVEFSWVDGEDTTGSSDPDGEADPDFAYASEHGSAEPVIARNNAPLQLEGVLRRLDGPHRPCVYVPRASKSDGSWTLEVLNRRQAHIYMRLTDSIRRDQVQGEPMESEVWRVNTVSGVEVV